MTRFRILTAMLLVGGISSSVLAWEMDLHYGLTKWLAFQAGFSLADAELIARGTQDPDEGKLYPAPSAVFAAACLGRHDADRSRLVQTYHFPSYGAIPGQPSVRAVTPGLTDNAATDLVEKEIQAVLPGQPHEKTLELLGVALHPLEDSWSHQGEPDIPWVCSSQFAYGHPSARGGWRKHDADLTYLHQVPDTLQTAQRTYEKLVAFLGKHPGMRDHAAVPWKALAPKVAEFAKAGSKSEKRAWFESQPAVPFASYTSYPKFLQTINVPDSPRKKTSQLGARVVNAAYAQESREAINPPKNVEGFVNQFLNLWIVKRRPEAALRLTNPGYISKAFAADGALGRPEDLTRSLLAMWLVRDHGLVNLMGHGVSAESSWQELEKLPQIEGGSLQSAITGSGDAPYELFPISEKQGVDSEGSGTYAAVFQFRHAPRDAVALILVRDPKGEWSVNGLLWWAL